ncbi:MAG: P-loop NTPase fold protein [Candidatus Omnitrophota bacterium]
MKFWKSDWFSGFKWLFIVSMMVLYFSISGVLFFRTTLRKQKICSQSSWVYYLFWDAIFALPVILYLWDSQIHHLKWKEIIISNPRALFFYATYLSIILLGSIIYRKIPKSKVNDNFRFSPDSVGLDRDALRFADIAKNAAQAISASQDYVTVVAVHGRDGSGKSSLARMIIESFDQNDILYSYISLTETNEVKGFSRLFSERWHETLNSRYPKIQVTEYIPLMNSIFRESGNNFYLELMNCCLKINFAPLPTRTKVCDKNNNNNNCFVTNEVAALFGNISEFKENLWIIVIDEFERSPLVETYRVIETIERFKMKGREGLPIRIIFMVCVGDDFTGLMQTAENKEIQYLVKNFFIDNPKNISHHLFLPPIQQEIREDFIIQKLIAFKKANNIEGLPNSNEDIERIAINPINRFLDEKSSISFVINILLDESPRTINRCILDVEFFYRAFRDYNGYERKDAIRFSDILLMSYIKIKHSDLIRFFSMTVEGLYRESEGKIDAKDMIIEIGRRNLEKMTAEKNEKEEEKLLKWIRDILDIPKEEYDKWKNPYFANLVAAISHSYIDRVNNLDAPESGINYDGTLSDPHRLYDYLTLISEFAEDTKKKLINIYRGHEQMKLDLGNLENSILISYSHMLRDIKKSPVRLNLDVATTLCNRIINMTIKLQPSATQRETVLADALYQFCFQLLEVIEDLRHNKKNSEYAISAINLFTTLLNSASVDTGSKFVVINSFANDERGGSSDIHFRLQNAFETMLEIDKDGILKAIQHVFNEADGRYLSGNDIIYDKEENFFYVLYQLWSGNKDNKEEIARIHAAASRGLENHLEVIKLYWEHFPAPLNAQNYDDALENDYSFVHTKIEFNITLEKLIEISDKQAPSAFSEEEKRKIELWKKIINNPEDAAKYYQKYAVKNDDTTLAAFLIRRKYLQNWPPHSIGVA